MDGWFHQPWWSPHHTSSSYPGIKCKNLASTLCTSVDVSFQSALLVEQAESPFFDLPDVSAWKPFSFLTHPPPTNTLLQTLRLMAFYKVENNLFPYRSSVTYVFILQLNRVINKKDSQGKIIFLPQYLHICWYKLSVRKTEKCVKKKPLWREKSSGTTLWTHFKAKDHVPFLCISQAH